MKKDLFTRARLGLGIVLAALSVAPVSASAATTSSVGCSILPVSQPFFSWGDSNWYSRLPGQTDANFVGTGWTLSGGASVASTTRADGRTGTVLNLPSGAVAISPPMCVASTYPTARTMVRDVVGSEGVFVSVSYAGSGWQRTGQVHGNGTSWALSTAVSIHSAPLAGWQQVRFMLVGGGNTSRFQVYNFWVDPRMS
jgi:hypothetical protein